ncbi:MAG: hypothetical protein NTX49_10135, partial [Chlamydiae bacterium]|nr:hypothetical protein [Chlamydiota bacterium]
MATLTVLRPDSPSVSGALHAAAPRRISLAAATERLSGVALEAFQDLSAKACRLEEENITLRRDFVALTAATAEKDIAIAATLKAQSDAITLLTTQLAALDRTVAVSVAGLSSSHDVMKAEFDKHDHLIHESNMSNTWQGWFRTKSAKAS